jgi:choline-phosphate cytidylyltransferase
VEAIRATGIADLIIVEEYEGQKIDDIRRYDVDVFTVGSDWIGTFDYLNEFCKVVYLERTQGVSSSELRTQERKLRIGFIGNNESRILNKYCSECKFVNGAEVSGICSTDQEVQNKHGDVPIIPNYEELLKNSDAVYIISHPSQHYKHIKEAILMGKHVLVELPITLDVQECRELYQLAERHNIILMPAMKTAYATAYNRLLLLIKSGRIGKVVSVDATCTSIRDINISNTEYLSIWNSICSWGPTAMLPIFHILGTDYKKANIISYYLDKKNYFDLFTKIDFIYENAVASLKVGRGVKSEGDLVITGTKGYVYVPAPWWKTDYFEIRYENSDDNRRYFYQLEGEGIRYELVAFIRAIKNGMVKPYISQNISETISRVIGDFYNGDGKIVQ